MRKNDDDFKGLLSFVQKFSDDIWIQFAKVTFKKGSLIKSKNITLDINIVITELQLYKTY